VKAAGSQGWLAGRRRCRLDDGEVIRFVEPAPEGLSAMRRLGWRAWLAELPGMDERETIVPLAPGGLEAVPETAANAREAIAGLTSGGRSPVVLARCESDEVTELCAFVPCGLTWFDGHFPRYPVVPGVVLIGWAAEWSATLRQGGRAIGGLRQVKFQRVVEPDTVIAFRAETAGPSAIGYVLESAAGIHARGTLELGGAR
jgi:hypothetical protein